MRPQVRLPHAVHSTPVRGPSDQLAAAPAEKYDGVQEIASQFQHKVRPLALPSYYEPSMPLNDPYITYIILSIPPFKKFRLYFMLCMPRLEILLKSHLALTLGRLSAVNNMLSTRQLTT